MPFEDVGYLKDNSIKESYVFFVDSKQRNKKNSPNPNEYTLEFDEPFVNVFSFEVLDASIPRTQYAVDTHNNILIFRYGQSLEYEGNITLTIGDYTDSNLVNEINTKMESHFGDSSLSDRLISVKTTSIPSNQKYTFTFYSNHFFIFDMYKSTISETLGFDTFPMNNDIEDSLLKYDTTDFVSGNELTVTSNKFPFVNFQSSEPIDNMSYFASVKNQLYEFPFHEEVSGLAHALEDNGTFLSAIDTSHNTIRQSFTSFRTGALHSITIHHDFEIVGSVIVELEGLGSVSSNVTLDPNNIVTFVTFDTVTDIYKDQNYTLKIIGTNSILQGISICEDIEGDLLESTRTSFGSEGDTVLTSYPYNIVFDIKLFEPNYTIIAPNMYSLIGDRYMLLKCPEIESHLHGSKAYERYSQGLAKFKLSVIGYDESRFDFASLTPRVFHPIARLSNLTLRFVRPDGKLYNFRGLNHTITFCIKYYTPKPLETFTKSTLAPQYDPDYFRYMQNQESDDGSDDGSSNDSDE